MLSNLPLVTPNGQAIINFKVKTERRIFKNNQKINFCILYTFSGKSNDGKSWQWVAVKAEHGFHMIVLKWEQLDEGVKGMTISDEAIEVGYSASRRYIPNGRSIAA